MPSPLGLVVKNGSNARAAVGAIHPDAGVADAQPDVAARVHVRPGARVGGVDVDVLGVERQRAAVGHRVARVDREVEQHLLELAVVGHDRPQVGRQRRLEHDVLAERAAQQLLHLEHDAGQVEHARADDLAAREREQLAREPRRRARRPCGSRSRRARRRVPGSARRSMNVA